MRIVSASVIVLAGSIIFASSVLAANSGTQQFNGLVGGAITGVGLYAWYLGITGKSDRG